MNKKTVIMLFASSMILGYSSVAQAKTYPGMTINSPTGFGMSGGSASIGVGATQSSTGSNGLSAAAVGSVGFGNAKSLAAQIDMVIASINAADGGFAEDGYFNVKVHKASSNGLSAVSVGHEGLVQWGDSKNDDATTYVAASKVIPLRNAKVLALSGGLGNGRLSNSSNNLSAFVAVAYVPNERVSLIADYSGDALKAGVSFVPSAQLPLSVTISTDNKTKNASFSVGYGFSF